MILTDAHREKLRRFLQKNTSIPLSEIEILSIIWNESLVDELRWLGTELKLPVHEMSIDDTTSITLKNGLLAIEKAVISGETIYLPMTNSHFTQVALPLFDWKQAFDRHQRSTTTLLSNTAKIIIILTADRAEEIDWQMVQRISDYTLNMGL